MGVGGVSNTLFGDMGQNKVNQYFPGTYSLEDRLGAVDSISSSMAVKHSCDRSDIGMFSDAIAAR